MIITIDGPAGAGKSTAARALARKLGFRFIDTGAMYRAVTLAALRQGVDWEQTEQLAELCRQIRIELESDRVLLDGEDVTRQVRAHKITLLTHYAASNPDVREHLVKLQRAAAGKDDVITEGRDQGTVVFPGAQCKIFLTASAEERARRRWLDLNDRGERIEFKEVLAKQNLRDDRDTSRKVGPLVPAPDAIQINTDGLTPRQVVERLETSVRARFELASRRNEKPPQQIT